MKNFLTQQINFGYAVIVMLALVVGLGSANAQLGYGTAPGGSPAGLIHQGGGDQAMNNLQAGGCSGASCTPLGEFDARGIANGVSHFLGSLTGSSFVSLGSTHLLSKVYIGEYNGELAGPNMDMWSNPASTNGISAPIQTVNVAGNVLSTHLANSGGNPPVCFTRNGTLVLCPQETASDGACGISDGGTFTSTPSAGLCSAGTASSVSSNPLADPQYTWSCFGSDGGMTDSCSANHQEIAVNGVCREYTGGPYSSQPATDTPTGCNSGTYQDIDDSGIWDGSTPWRWRCLGENGGSNATNCTAPRIGIIAPYCSSYPGTYATQPATNSANGCDVGTFSEYPDSPTEWQWRCTENGVNQTCTAEKGTSDGNFFVCGQDGDWKVGPYANSTIVPTYANLTEESECSGATDPIDFDSGIPGGQDFVWAQMRCWNDIPSNCSCFSSPITPQQRC